MRILESHYTSSSTIRRKHKSHLSIYKRKVKRILQLGRGCRIRKTYIRVEHCLLYIYIWYWQLLALSYFVTIVYTKKHWRQVANWYDVVFRDDTIIIIVIVVLYNRLTRYRIYNTFCKEDINSYILYYMIYVTVYDLQYTKWIRIVNTHYIYYIQYKRKRVVLLFYFLLFLVTQRNGQKS